MLLYLLADFETSWNSTSSVIFLIKIKQKFSLALLQLRYRFSTAESLFGLSFSLAYFHRVGFEDSFVKTDPHVMNIVCFTVLYNSCYSFDTFTVYNKWFNAGLLIVEKKKRKIFNYKWDNWCRASVAWFGDGIHQYYSLGNHISTFTIIDNHWEGLVKMNRLQYSLWGYIGLVITAGQWSLFNSYFSFILVPWQQNSFDIEGTVLHRCLTVHLVKPIQHSYKLEVIVSTV